MNKVRALLQAVGFLTLGLLAIYGVLAFAGGAGPLPGALSAHAQEALPTAEVAAPELITGTLVAAPDAASGSIAPTVNYQGFLRDASGKLVTGKYKMTLSIWTLAAGGDLKYQVTVEDVAVRDGLFNVVLEDTASYSIAAALSDTPRYVGIDLNDSAGELVPRQRVHSVPWAMTASTLVQNATVGSITANLVTANDVAAPTSVKTNYAEINKLTVAPNGGGELHVFGDAEVSGKLAVPRTYATFAVQVLDHNLTNSKPMGQWDICFLTGSSFWTAGAWLGVPNFDGALCHVIMEGKEMEGWFQDHPPLVVNRGERKSWTLWANTGDRAQTARCQAMCMNIGQ